ncbi:MAG TPA: GAF domain-containing sensor histidine kinase [Anaerolineales bacterium]|nr:GAF domain-containing sensor histidine kinase [Anaerolineales bacterium]
MKSTCPDQKLISNLQSAIKSLNSVIYDDRTSINSLLKIIAIQAATLSERSECSVHLVSDTQGDRFDPLKRILALKTANTLSETASDTPREEGLGYRTLNRRESVISYQENGLTLHPYFIGRGAAIAICHPLIVDQNLIGVLYIYLQEEREFSDIEISSQRIFSDHAAMALYLLRKQEKLSYDLLAKQKQLIQLQSAAKALFSKQNLHDTLHTILDLALEITGAEYGIFRLVDEKQKHLLTYSFSGSKISKPKVEALPINQKSVMGSVALSRRTILIDDILANPHNYYPLSEDIVMRSELAIPLIAANGGLEGVLNLESPQPGTFTHEHQILVESLCTFATIAIQEFRLLESLIAITNGIQELGIEELINLILKRSISLLNADEIELWRTKENKLVKIGSTSSYNSAETPEIIQTTYKSILASENSISGRLSELDQYYRSKLKNEMILNVLSDRENQSESFFLATTLKNRTDFSENDRRIIHFIGSLLILAEENETRKLKLATEQQQRQTAETFAAVGDVASNVLHTVNNRVGLIPVKIQSLRAKRETLFLEDTYLSKSLEEIVRYAVDTLKTVSDNMDNLRPIKISTVNLLEVIEESIHYFHEVKGISFSIHSSDNSPTVIANHKNLLFIIQNIIDNAIRVMTGIGKIDFLIQTNQQETVLYIRDNGPGIEQPAIEQLFQFGANAKGQSNLGFGLWWAKTMMARLGGSISVSSSVGEGTTFGLHFPLSGLHD